ncbi:MAG: hypothetical protein QM737_15545 [Ferruginibacter sp.]
MKTISFILISALIFVCSCKKHHDNVVPINCDGLVTDTLGTGDTAKIYMVNAFTPNGDGLNDVCRGIVFGGSSYILTIYDENNNVVFTGTTHTDYFEPTLPSTYTKYYYKMQVTTAQGHHIGECGDLYAMSCRPSNLTLNDLRLEDELTYSGWTHTTIDTIANHACQ